MSEENAAQIFMGLEVENNQDRIDLIKSFESVGIKCLDLSEDELSKGHLRHMVGGRLPSASKVLCEGACKEMLYRFEFPERPGALMRFVTKMRPEWSISIFHYRNHGADVGRIVIGVLVQQKEMESWKRFLKEIGYKNWNETENPAYKLFLGAHNL